MTGEPDEWDALTAAELRGRASAKWDPTAHPEVLGAWVAEMDFGTAPPVLEAWQRSARDLEFGYASPAMIAELTAATARWCADEYGWQIEASDVALLPDVIAGLQVAITDFSQPGAAVIVPTPAYHPFLFVPGALGSDVIEVPMLRDERAGFGLDLARIDAELGAGAGLVILANPGNPTGKVYRRDELEALADLVDSHGARVFSDEIHAPLTLFGNRHTPLASVSEAGARVAITATSASKAWNLAGLKCAQLILSNDRDREVWSRITRLISHGASTPGIRANTAAYNDGREWLTTARAYLEGNYAVLLAEVRSALPLARVAPLEATYLCWIDLSAYRGADEDVDFAELLLAQAGVRVNGGATFGEVGAGHVRLNIATSKPILREIVGRMAAALGPRR